MLSPSVLRREVIIDSACFRSNTNNGKILIIKAIIFICECIILSHNLIYYKRSYLLLISERCALETESTVWVNGGSK